MLCKNCQVNEVPAYRVKAYCYLCNACKKLLYPPNKQKNREGQQRHWDKHRDLLFSHYGKECVYCGSTENLQFDHTDAAKLDRKKRRNGWSQLSWYKELIANDFPPTCQTLCKRCNYAKQRMSDADFKKMIKEVYSHLFRNNNLPS